ncbi:MAG: iron-sulfur cluster assembly scaffold protein [Anaerolineae bacterium]
MYSKTVMDHFARPRNVGVIENADGFARVKSPVHDDLIDLYIRVEGGRIIEVKYRTFGCAAAIAASSMASELVQGLTLAEATRFTEEQVVQALDGLPEAKIQCSVLLPQALRAALEDYYRKHPEARPDGPADES